MDYPIPLPKEFKAALADPSVAIGYDPQVRVFSFYQVRHYEAPIDEPSPPTGIKINNCPWSGVPMPNDLAQAWYRIAFIDYGCIEDDPGEIEEQMPDEMMSDAWWKERLDRFPEWDEHRSIYPGAGEPFPANKPIEMYVNAGAPGLTRFPERPPHLCWESEELYCEPETMYAYLPWTREYGIRVIDPNSPVDFQPLRITPVRYCPFCGSKLPPPLRVEWTERVRELGLDAADSTPEEREAIPPELISDSWWKSDPRLDWSQPDVDEPEKPAPDQTRGKNGVEEPWLFVVSEPLAEVSNPCVAIDYEPMFRFFSIYRIEPGKTARETLGDRAGWWLVGEPIAVDPWGGGPLPKPTGANWERIARSEYGVDRFPIEDIQSLPEDLKGDAWWRDRLSRFPEWNQPQLPMAGHETTYGELRGNLYRATGLGEEIGPESYRNRPQHACASMLTHVYDPTVMFDYLPWVREYGVRVIDLDEPLEVQPLRLMHAHFCPWCGESLPTTLRIAWEYRLAQMGLRALDETPEDLAKLPPEFASDEWWEPKKWGGPNAY